MCAVFLRAVGTILVILGGGIIQNGTIAHGSLELRGHESPESRTRASSLAKVTLVPTFIVNLSGNVQVHGMALLQ